MKAPFYHVSTSEFGLDVRARVQGRDLVFGHGSRHRYTFVFCARCPGTSAREPSVNITLRWLHIRPPYLIDPCIYHLHTATNQSSDVPKLYEGDMALTEEQALLLGKTRTPAANKSWDEVAHTRGAIRNPAQLWPDGIIPFKISSRIGIITYALF